MANAHKRLPIYYVATTIALICILPSHSFVSPSSYHVKKFNEQSKGIGQAAIFGTLLNSSNESIEEPSSITTATAPKEEQSYRKVAKLQKYARLPVWPAWCGVFIFLVSKLLGNEVAADLEHSIGGRVCPNFFTPEETTPFVLLVHHVHSFAAWDIFRQIQKKWILPEGFPAHPHRGFITITYILRGGFRHRDSLGTQQLYGADDNNKYKGKHTQWMVAGSGMLHEEMWDLPEKEDWFRPSHQELYQIWLNLPSADKMMPPSCQLLGGEEDTPTVVTTSEETGATTSTLIICGDHANKKGGVHTQSPVDILHVQMDPKSTWHHTVPPSHKTVIVYVRRGSLQIGDEVIPVHHTAYLTPTGSTLKILASDQKRGADFMLLSGAPLMEPIAAQGSMVMNTQAEIQQAYRDYSMLSMGKPWSETLDDEEWRQHVEQFPSIYK